MAKKKIASLADVAKLYGGKLDKSGYMPGSYNFKNFGLDDLAQAIYAKTSQGATKAGVYLNKRQAARYADVVNYAKGLGIEIGIAKAGMKNRPYDLMVGSPAGAGGSGSSRTGRISSSTNSTAEDMSGIANKIIAEIGKKRTQYGDY